MNFIYNKPWRSSPRRINKSLGIKLKLFFCVRLLKRKT